MMIAAAVPSGCHVSIVSRSFVASTSNKPPR